MHNFTQLKNLLPRAIARYGVSREVRAALIRDRAKNTVAEIWGDDSGIRPVYFNEGILTVEVDHSALAQEVFMKKAKFIELVEAGAGLPGVIKDIRTRVSG